MSAVTPKKTLVPRAKVGTPFQSPAWRVEALRNPARFGMASVAAWSGDINTTARSLYRLSDWKEIKVTSNVVYPEAIQNILDMLTPEQRQLYLLQLPHDRQRLTFDVGSARFTNWNIGEARKKINDAPMLQLVEHASGMIHNEDIAFALKLGSEDAQSIIAKFIGYSIFLGKSDFDIFKVWHIAPKRVAWFRLLFFDFSHFPKHPVAQWALLRQLTHNDIFTEIDFNFFKRMHDLGDLALKALCDFNNLTAFERESIEKYLGNSAILNVMDQHAAIRNKQDALDYTKSVMEFAKLKVQIKNVANIEAMTQLNVAKLGSMASLYDGVSADEQTLIDEVRRRGLVDAPPQKVKSLAELQ